MAKSPPLYGIHLWLTEQEIRDLTSRLGKEGVDGDEFAERLAEDIWRQFLKGNPVRVREKP